MVYYKYVQQGMIYSAAYAAGVAYNSINIDSEMPADIISNQTTNRVPGSKSPITGDIYAGVVESTEITLEGHFRDSMLLSRILGKASAEGGDYTEQLETPDLGENKPDLQFTFCQRYTDGAGTYLDKYFENCRLKNISIESGSYGGVTCKAKLGLGIPTFGTAPSGGYGYLNTTAGQPQEYQHSATSLKYDIGSGDVALPVNGWSLVLDLDGLESYKTCVNTPTVDRFLKGWRNGELITLLGFQFYAQNDTLLQEVMSQSSVDLSIEMKKDTAGNQKWMADLDDCIPCNQTVLKSPGVGDFALYTVAFDCPDPVFKVKEGILGGVYEA